MDRRSFLRSLGAGVAGGVIAHATGADVGLWADMMAWLKGPRKTYFIGADLGFQDGAMTYSQIDAITLKYMSEKMSYLWSSAEYEDGWFKDRYLEGGGTIMVPFKFEGLIDEVKL